jgi:hypothetical protein
MKKARSFVVSLAAIVLAAAASVACGGPLTYQVQGSQVATGADAKVVADVDEAKHQTKLTVEAENLAPPDRISESAKVFVLWQRKNADAPWSRIGTLEYDADKRKGKFEGTVPESSFDFEVSAEAEPNVASPSGKVVFDKRVAK